MFFHIIYNCDGGNDQLSLGGCQTAVRADWSSGHGEKKSSDTWKVATSDEKDNQEVPSGGERLGNLMKRKAKKSLRGWNGKKFLKEERMACLIEGD